MATGIAVKVGDGVKVATGKGETWESGDTCSSFFESELQLLTKRPIANNKAAKAKRRPVPLLSSIGLLPSSKPQPSQDASHQNTDNKRPHGKVQEPGL